MHSPELSISITTCNGFPFISVRGTVSAWHGRLIEDVVMNYLLEGTRAIMIDLSNAVISDSETMSLLIRTLRAGGTQMQMTVAANGRIIPLLRMAGLDPSIKICGSVDEAVDVVKSANVPQDFLSSRWIPQAAEDEDLPLAA